MILSIQTKKTDSFCWASARRLRCWSSATAIGGVRESYASSLRVEQTLVSVGCIRKGGLNEKALRFLEGKTQPVRKAAQASGDDSVGRGDHSLLQRLGGRDRHRIPDADQPLSP